MGKKDMFKIYNKHFRSLSPSATGLMQYTFYGCMLVDANFIYNSFGRVQVCV